MRVNPATKQQNIFLKRFTSALWLDLKKVTFDIYQIYNIDLKKE